MITTIHVNFEDGTTYDVEGLNIASSDREVIANAFNEAKPDVDISNLQLTTSGSVATFHPVAVYGK